MTPDKQNRPGSASRAVPEDERLSGGNVSTTVQPAGCPCGCRSAMPWLDDSDCLRHRPLTYDWYLYGRIAA
jgi:hypothetical protein